MLPHIRIFLFQTIRSTRQLMLQLALLCVASGFFVLSLNLYANSSRNLQTVENTYSSIATAEFYGYVNQNGDLVHPGDESSVGRHWLSVNDFDLSSLLALDSVEKIDLRTRVGAYISGHHPVYDIAGKDISIPPECVAFFSHLNEIQFVLDSEEPMVISLQEDQPQYLSFPIRILHTSNPLLKYPDTFTLCVPPSSFFDHPQIQEDVRSLNRSDCIDSITLYPDVEYVLASRDGAYWEKDPVSGIYYWRGDGAYVYYDGIGLSIKEFGYYDEEYLYYHRGGLAYKSVPSVQQREPLKLQRYEDVKDDPSWVEYLHIMEYDSCSFAVTLTEDIFLVPAWHQGAMFLNEGRMITKEEYASGAKVCMVSAQMAAYQGWQVGDKLDMHLYGYNAFYDQTSNPYPNWNVQQNYIPPPSYLQDCGGFFEEDTYEIVGIFGQREFTNFSGTAPEVFYNPWNAIYIPANAAPNAPEGPIQPSLLTIHLKNGQIGAFKQAVEEMGLTESRLGEYEIKFSYFDQGYSKIADALAEMNRNAILLLSLSAVLLLVTMILMAFLFSRQHKHSAGILRMLGGSKKQAFAAILTCAAAVVLLGALAGAVLGGALTQSVGASILGSAAESAKVALSTGASPVLTMLSGIGCMVLFLVLTAIFTGTYIGQEPRALLPEDKN